MKFVVALAALALVITGLLAFRGTGASAEGRRAPNTISVFVTFKSDFDGDGDTHDRNQEAQSEDQYVESHGGHVSHRYSLTDAVAIDVAPEDFGALTADPRVESVQADIQVSIADAELDASWGVKHVGSEANHTAGYRGAGVKVGVIDTGINRTHVDLAPNYDASCSYDFVNNDTDPMDDHGHGSHVSGIIAGADNGTGVVGMAPDATICAYKVLGSTGSGSYSAILAALDRAYTDGVKVVNLSLGSGYPGSVVEAAFATAHTRGITVVAAAGNASPCTSPATLPPADNEIYPAAFPDVIAVAATNSDDTRACFSSVGADVEIAAPGSGVVSAYMGSNTAYASMSGTSMATPHVAGLAAVLLGCHPMTNDQVTAVLDGTAQDLDSPVASGFPDGRDTWFGYGVIRAQNATTLAGCQAGSPATSTPTNTSTNTPTRTNTPAATRTNTPLPPTATPTSTNTPTNTPLVPAPTNTSTNTPLPPTATRTPTNTPIAPSATPTRTNTPTATRTNTPTPTSTPGASGGSFYFSLSSAATLNGTAFDNEDIVSWNGSTFTMFFDGSDVIPTPLVIDGFAVVGNRDVLVSFTTPGTLAGAGAFDDSDILRFTASSLGTTTAGTWAMYFDGSDVGLGNDDEDIDALEILPSGHLLVSTVGQYGVTGASGDDRDVIEFSPTMLGATTTGTWSMYFDGSDVGLDNDTEDVDGLAVSTNGAIYVSTTGAFSVPGLTGQDEDVVRFSPIVLGSATSGSFAAPLFFDGSAYGLSANDVTDIDLP
jgi:subtilisin